MTDGEVRNVLVTGAGGLIGGAVVRLLAEDYMFTGQDIRPLPDAPIPVSVSDLADYDAMRPAFDGVDGVIHLGADSAQDAPWESVLPNNLVATHNVFEAARDAGVRRVVFASSNHAVGMFEHDDPYVRIRAGDYDGLDPANIPQIDHRVQVRPDGHYGISKAYGEATGAYYAENFGMSVACLRIGSVNRADRPVNVRTLATWCSQRDVVQLIDRCLGHNGLKFDIFYGVSANKWRFWDISHARDVLGYEPADNAEDYRGEVLRGG